MAAPRCSLVGLQSCYYHLEAFWGSLSCWQIHLHPRVIFLTQMKCQNTHMRLWVLWSASVLSAAKQPRNGTLHSRASSSGRMWLFGFPHVPFVLRTYMDHFCSTVLSGPIRARSSWRSHSIYLAHTGTAFYELWCWSSDLHLGENLISWWWRSTFSAVNRGICISPASNVLTRFLAGVLRRSCSCHTKICSSPAVGKHLRPKPVWAYMWTITLEMTVLLGNS